MPNQGFLPMLTYLAGAIEERNCRAKFRIAKPLTYY
jgi:hypothetical protein